jgi:cysteine dioxygenase
MAQNVATEQLTITDWVKGLAAIPDRDFTLENVQDYIIRHSVRPETLDKYCYFSKGNYTRNLIFKNGVFECMTICWEIGQASRIHNHRDQNCWMSAPIGRLKVQNFRVDDRDAALGTCRIIPTDIYEMDAVHPAYVNPLEPVHQVLNPVEFKAFRHLRGLPSRKRYLRRCPPPLHQRIRQTEPCRKALVVAAFRLRAFLVALLSS